jgi:hypothetical protein
MARPRKPESQLSPDCVVHNKGLYATRDREPKVKGELGAPSRWLTKEQKKIWKLLVKNSPAILGESDRTLLEIAVVLKDRLEAGNIENSQITQLIQCLTKLGMVPLTRQAVPTDQAPVADEWDDILASRTYRYPPFAELRRRTCPGQCFTRVTLS